MQIKCKNRKGNNNMNYVAPSLLACDFSRMREEIADIWRLGAEMAHLDVMDGVFVPNVTFDATQIASVREAAPILFDVHLMIANPDEAIDAYALAGADYITVHYEACEDVKKTLARIRALGKKAGVSVKPNTPIERIYPYLDQLDMVLVMTVEPGFGGQKLIPSCLEKVAMLRKKLDAENREILIEVDGGINRETASLATQAGANVLVAGSAVFGAPDRAEMIEFLKQA
jgi:ribulose-phosphate 3-epimerase